MKVTLTVCDVCRDPALPATTYQVASNGRSAETDRCEAHGKPLEQVFDTPETPSPMTASAAPAKRRRGRTPVTTMEEIEARKRTT